MESEIALNPKIGAVLDERLLQLLDALLQQTRVSARKLETPDAALGLAELDEELTNLVAALDTFAAYSQPTLYDLAADLYLSIGNYLDVRAMLAEKQRWGWALVQVANATPPQEVLERAAAVVGENGTPVILLAEALAQVDAHTLRDYAEAYNTYGMTVWQTSNVELALAYLRQALRLFKYLKNDFGTMGVLMNMSHFYHGQGRFEKCIPVSRSALKFAIKTQDPKLEAHMCFHLASVLEMAQQIEEIEALYERAIALYSGTDADEDLAFVKFGYAQYCYQRGKRERALLLMRESAALMKKARMPDLPSTLAWIEQVEKEL
jgi:tetratricopeptide (TPR) repeat protein